MIAYKLADIGFGFDTDEEIAPADYYSRFRISETEFDSLKERHVFSFRGNIESLPDFGNILFSSSEQSVYEYGDGYARVLNRFDTQSYKCVCFQSPHKPGGEIYFTRGGETARRTEAELFRIIDLFSALLFYDAFIIHGSAVELDGKVCIFSGDSGIGKSTQARLWKKHNGAQILNGDRVILRRVGDEWKACGLPMCGSSDICRVFSLPVQAVVFLGQARKNKVYIPDDFNKIMLTVSQSGCGTGKREDSVKILSLAESMAGSIKIIKYECTARKKAAVYLKEYLDNYE